MKKPLSMFDKATVKFDYQAIYSAIGNNTHSTDCDDAEGILNVVCAKDADMHLWVLPHENKISLINGVRKRTYIGGGRHERIRKAMMLLALAIKEDRDL